MKKFLSILLSLVMVCSSLSFAFADEALPNFLDIKLGEDYIDLAAEIKVLTHRTDLTNNGALDGYVAEFNKLYPNIKVTYEGITDYASDSLIRMTGSDDWGDVLNIPQIENSEFPSYFHSFGSVADVGTYVNYADAKQFDGQAYGIATTANFNGILYNKAVFEAAGVTEIPRTPDAFIAALELIKANTDAIPLYTNYAAGWTMGAWDAYAGYGATGNVDFANIDMITMQDPFTDKGDGTGAAAVYKILYDATAKGLIEEDYTTTDWEGCKPMINNGQIGTMVLGSWAYVQMRDAVGGEHPEDVAYMPFPITVDGKQYANAGADYCYGINAKIDDTRKLASMIFVKWMVELSNFTFNEGGAPVLVNGQFPDFAASFDGVTMAPDTMVDGDAAQLVDDINADSTLMFNKSGNEKIQKVVEHAFNGDMTFDELMASWNALWSSAQEDLGVVVAQ